VKPAGRSAAQNAMTLIAGSAPMSQPTDDTATIQALLDRLLHFRLPRALEIKKHVETGARLDDSEIDFLKRALEEAQQGQKFVSRNPQFHALGAQIAQLYDDIVSRALENEKQAK
jgi:hypothetical protein